MFLSRVPGWAEVTCYTSMLTAFWISFRFTSIRLFYMTLNLTCIVSVTFDLDTCWDVVNGQFLKSSALSYAPHSSQCTSVKTHTDVVEERSCPRMPNKNCPSWVHTTTWDPLPFSHGEKSERLLAPAWNCNAPSGRRRLSVDRSEKTIQPRGAAATTVPTAVGRSIAG